MSGTSVDGIDAGLVDFSTGKPELLAFHYLPYPAELKRQIQQISQPEHPVFLQQYGALDAHLGTLFAETTLALLAKAKLPPQKVAAIGSHGQTVYHAPEGEQGFSLQIGDPNRIAQITGITTVCDFRRRDIALGGQGAPLVPAFHHAVFTCTDHTVSVVNIGGIANISILQPESICGFDTGPGNTLMDYWCQTYLGKDYDAGGDWAACGQVQAELLQQLLDDSYFRLPPPKSTGKEYFSTDWLLRRIACFPDLSPADVQATLCQLTADSISQAIIKHAPYSQRVLICGGGAHNHSLMKMLKANLPMPLASTAEYGINPDHVEAIAFAWLARQTLHGLAGNLCSVTGAQAPAILGGIYPGCLAG